MAQATREQRAWWSLCLVGAALVAGFVGVMGYLASRPGLEDSAHNAAVSMQCVEGGVCGSMIEAQPLWLYAGGGVVLVLLAVAFLLMATRPAVP